MTISLSKIKDEIPKVPSLSAIEAYGQLCLIEGIRVAGEYLEHGLRDGAILLYGPADPADVQTCVDFIDDTYTTLKLQHERTVGP